jgi:hypothetical protein
MDDDLQIRNYYVIKWRRKHIIRTLNYQSQQSLLKQ